MTHSHLIEILLILSKYVFDLGVRLTEFSVTVESVTLRFYCIYITIQVTAPTKKKLWLFLYCNLYDFLFTSITDSICSPAST